MKKQFLFRGALVLAVLAAACSKKEDRGGQAATRVVPGPQLAAGPGVDVANKTLFVGLLNDESGPAAIIGKPYAVGKRILAAQVNAGSSGLLPPGWRLELIERDHQYNPQRSLQEYQAMRERVLFIGHSFGTPNTLPLRPMLQRDNMIAFPASLSSEMASHEHTPPLGPSYRVEAMRALDWAIDHAGGADKVRAAIVYQKDDYGKDGLQGWKEASQRRGVAMVSEQTVAPAQKDMTAVVTALKQQGANYVLLTTLPGSTAPILGTAAQLGYSPNWIGNTPSWIDRFFDPSVIPAAVFATYVWVTGVAYWGENVPGMKGFMAAYERWGKDQHPPDFYIVTSYVQGLIALEVFRRAFEAQDATRAGYKKALQSLDNYTAGGIIQPIGLSSMPYQTSVRTHILRPDFARKSWVEMAPYAAPTTLPKG